MRNRYLQAVALLALVVAFAPKVIAAENAAQETEKPEKQPELTLQVAAVLVESGPLLAYTARNNSSRDIVMDEAGVNSSPIVIIGPDGKEHKYFNSVSRTEPLPRVKAKSSATRKDSAFDLFTRMRLNAPGVYRVFWQVRLDNPRRIYTSNEILVLREESTPVIDPTTGRPIARPDQNK